MRRHGGFVLVVVLWVLALMSIVAIGVSHRAFLERRASAYALDQAQAMMMARGAAHRGIVEVRNKIFKDNANPKGPDSSAHLGQAWARRTVLSGNGGPLELGENFPDDAVWFQVYDESSRPSINAAGSDQLDELFGAIDKAYDVMPLSVRRRIRSRILDGDHADEPGAAFQTLEEVRQVRGIDEEDWLGKDGMPGIRDLFTAHGTARININTAPPYLLDVIPGLAARDVDRILAYRAGDDEELATRDDRGFRNFDDLAEKVGIANSNIGALRPFVSFASAFYRVEGYATRRNGRVRARVRAIVRVTQSMSRGSGGAIILSWEETSFGA